MWEFLSFNSNNMTSEYGVQDVNFQPYLAFNTINWSEDE